MTSEDGDDDCVSQLTVVSARQGEARATGVCCKNVDGHSDLWKERRGEKEHDKCYEHIRSPGNHMRPAFSRATEISSNRKKCFMPNIFFWSPSNSRIVATIISTVFCLVPLLCNHVGPTWQRGGALAPLAGCQGKKRGGAAEDEARQAAVQEIRDLSDPPPSVRPCVL